MSQGLSNLAKALSGVTGQANNSGTALGQLEGFLGKCATAAIKSQVALAVFVNGMEKAIGSLGSQFTKFVQLANPATVILFNLAMENFISAIGQILTPVLIKLTPIIQQMANALVSLDEPSKKLLAALAIGSALAAAIGAVVFAIVAVVSVLGGWVTALIALAGAVAGMVIASDDGKKVMEMFRSVLTTVGTVFQAIAKPISAILLKIGEAVAPLIAALLPLIEAFGELFAAVVGLLSIPMQILLGVLKVLTPIIAGIAKVVSAVVKVISTLIDILSQLVGGILEKIGSVVLAVVIPVIEKMVEALTWLANQILAFVNRVRAVFGLSQEKAFDPEKNRAQAVVKSSSIGDVQSFLKRAYEQSATGSGQTIPQAQLEQLKQINTGVGGLASGIGAAVAAAVRPAAGAASPSGGGSGIGAGAAAAAAAIRAGAGGGDRIRPPAAPYTGKYNTPPARSSDNGAIIPGLPGIPGWMLFETWSRLKPR